MNLQETLSVFNNYFGEDKVDYNSQNNSIIIYFPTLTIENENHLTETIYDTYVFIPLEMHSNGDVVYNDSMPPIKLLRTTYTMNQVLHNYTHSHISGLAITNPRPFCTGTAPINQTIATLSNSPTVELWMLFCAELYAILQTESIAGVPYNYIANLSRTTDHSQYISLNNNEEEQLYDLTDKFIDHLFVNFPFNLVWHIDHYQLNTDKFQCRLILTKLFLTFIRHISDSILNKIIEECGVRNHEFYAIENSEVNCQLNITDSLILFKNECKYLKVINSEDSKERHSIILIKKSVSDMLESKILNVVNKYLSL